MRKFGLFFSFFIVLLCCISCSEDIIEEVSAGSITGKVVKKGTNEALANVKIFTSPFTSTVFTGTDGTFTIANVPLGDYSLKAELTGYVSTFKGVNLKTSNQNVEVIFELGDDASFNSPPSIPELLTPVDNAVEQPVNITFTWSSTDPDAGDVLKYDVILKNSANANVQTVTDITATSYTPGNLQFGTSYFWQIAVSDGVNPKVYSPLKQFKTTTVPTNRFHYLKKTNGNWNIISSNEQGGNQFDLTLAAQNTLRPRVNNAAGLIAFLRNVNGNYQIFTANKDGSNSTQITNLPPSAFKNDEIDFSWNTTGNQIVYANFNKLYKVNKDGSGLSLLYTTADGSLISECDWSTDGSKIALKTNDNSGYNARIFIIDMLGNVVKQVVNSGTGGAGGLNFSADGSRLLYTRDVSGYQDPYIYRQLDSRIFIINLNTNAVEDLSAASQKPNGMNDLDPRFSPDDGHIIFVQTSNDGISQKNIYKIFLDNSIVLSRTLLFSNAEMPDWE